MNRIEEAVAEAKKIEGWMNEDELRWLAAQAVGRQCIVEFGIYRGRSTKAITMATDGVVYAVDCWAGDMLRDIYPEFVRSFWREIDAGKVIPQRVWTRNYFYPQITPPDMFFIDADHSYVAVRDDIVTGLRLLKKGGLLCGHDFSNDYPGVKKAVEELVPGYGRVAGGDIWYKEIV